MGACTASSFKTTNVKINFHHSRSDDYFENVLRDRRVRESDKCVDMVTRARSYHELSYEDKLAHWRLNKKPSRWPQLLAAISYAEKLIECYDFEECDWAVLTEKPGHVFGSAMCCMQGQVMINVDSNREALRM